MTQIEKLVRHLAQGNNSLAKEVLSEIKELLVDENEGEWRVNSKNALRLAFELDRASEEQPLPSKMETHQALLKSGANPVLVNQIFAANTARI